MLCFKELPAAPFVDWRNRVLHRTCRRDGPRHSRPAATFPSAPPIFGASLMSTRFRSTTARAALVAAVTLATVTGAF
ncbi:hypothetical protein, partial [Rhodoplanes serenus]|uniref:hypothetical protein n=1 Tax=Rhodoplanes serenus TaxID=200615 RepID=UPI001AECBC24